jgi:hypothetical protein
MYVNRLRLWGVKPLRCNIPAEGAELPEPAQRRLLLQGGNGSGKTVVLRPLNSKESGEVRRRGDSGRSAGNPDGRSLGLRPLAVVAKSPQDREHGLGAGAIDEFVRVIALVE